MKNEKPKRPAGPTSMKGRIIVVVSGVIILIILAMIISSIVSGGDKTPGLLKVAQDQTEIIRLTGNASQHATSTATRQFAVTTQLSTTSARSEVLAYLKTAGIKYGTKDLNMTASATVDKQLASAAAASLYDTTYESVMKTQLTSYSADLKTAYDATSAPKLRTLLNNDYKSAQLLLSQVAETTAP